MHNTKYINIQFIEIVSRNLEVLDNIIYIYFTLYLFDQFIDSLPILK